MKKLFAVAVTALLCCSATYVSAQNKIEKINMTYGEELPDDGGKIVKIIGETKEKIYALVLKGPEFLSFIPIYKDGQLNILINDHIKNKGITDIEAIRSMGNYNNAVPSLFVFDSNNGTMSRKDPEDVVKNELVIRPGVYCRKNDKEFIIYASRNSKDKLGRMILED